MLVHLPQPHVPGKWESTRLTSVPGYIGALCQAVAQAPIAGLGSPVPFGQGVPAESAGPGLPVSLLLSLSLSRSLCLLSHAHKF